jgi:DNA-binding MarR family transcriptional regulator
MNSLTRSSTSNSSNRFDPIEIWKAISNNYKSLHRDAERALNPTGLSLAELRILYILNESGPLPMRKLTDGILLTPGAMTGLIDGLEHKGLLKELDPNMIEE